jgi:hypothetical protein
MTEAEMSFNLTKQDLYVALVSSGVTILVLSFVSHIPAVGAVVKFILGI